MKRRVREEEEVGELNIIPYLDIVVNLVMFMLLSMVGLMSLGILDVATPRSSDGPSAQVAQDDPNKPKLMLTVAISDKGFYVAGTGGVLEGETPAADGSNNVDTKRPPTLPRKSGEYDYAGLSRLLGTIKDKYPKEGTVILISEMSIPYEVLIATMDACRETTVRLANGDASQKILFPEVMLSVLQQ